jgi:hypothetical protein
VQISGTALSINASQLREIARTHIALQEAIARFDQLIFTQMVQRAACIAAYNVEARLRPDGK